MASSTYKLPANVIYTDPGDLGYFGLKDLDQLEKQGLTLQEIAAFAADPANVPFGVGKAAGQIFQTAGYPYRAATTTPGTPAQQQYLSIQQQLTQQSQASAAAAQKQIRQMQIAQAMGRNGSASVKGAKSKAQTSKLTIGGTSGFFGRKGMRIAGVNVPTPGAGGAIGSFGS